MKCPFCESSELKVVDSREAIDGKAIRRRRECQGCQRRFTTFETLELTVQVHKRDGRYEDFSQLKLIAGIEAACRHTTVSREQVIQIATSITNAIMEKQVRDIETEEVGEMVMQSLRHLDPIAYIRFACEYRRFKDIDELMVAIQTLPPKDKLSS